MQPISVTVGNVEVTLGLRDSKEAGYAGGSEPLISVASLAKLAKLSSATPSQVFRSCKQYSANSIIYVEGVSFAPWSLSAEFLTNRSLLAPLLPQLLAPLISLASSSRAVTHYPANAAKSATTRFASESVEWNRFATVLVDNADRSQRQELQQQLLQQQRGNYIEFASSSKQSQHSHVSAAKTTLVNTLCQKDEALSFLQHKPTEAKAELARLDAQSPSSLIGVSPAIAEKELIRQMAVQSAHSYVPTSLIDGLWALMQLVPTLLTRLLQTLQSRSNHRLTPILIEAICPGLQEALNSAAVMKKVTLGISDLQWTRVVRQAYARATEIAGFDIVPSASYIHSREIDLVANIRYFTTVQYASSPKLPTRTTETGGSVTLPSQAANAGLFLTARTVMQFLLSHPTLVSTWQLKPQDTIYMKTMIDARLLTKKMSECLGCMAVTNCLELAAASHNTVPSLLYTGKDSWSELRTHGREWIDSIFDLLESGIDSGGEHYSVDNDFVTDGGGRNTTLGWSGNGSGKPHAGKHFTQDISRIPSKLLPHTINKRDQAKLAAKYHPKCSHKQRTAGARTLLGVYGDNLLNTEAWDVLIGILHLLLRVLHALIKGIAACALHLDKLEVLKAHFTECLGVTCLFDGPDGSPAAGLDGNRLKRLLGQVSNICGCKRHQIFSKEQSAVIEDLLARFIAIRHTLCTLSLTEFVKGAASYNMDAYLLFEAAVLVLGSLVGTPSFRRLTDDMPYQVHKMVKRGSTIGAQTEEPCEASHLYQKAMFQQSTTKGGGRGKALDNALSTKQQLLDRCFKTFAIRERSNWNNSTVRAKNADINTRTALPKPESKTPTPTAAVSPVQSDALVDADAMTDSAVRIRSSLLPSVSTTTSEQQPLVSTSAIPTVEPMDTSSNTGNSNATNSASSSSSAESTAMDTSGSESKNVSQPLAMTGKAPALKKAAVRSLELGTYRPKAAEIRISYAKHYTEFLMGKSQKIKIPHRHFRSVTASSDSSRDNVTVLFELVEAAKLLTKRNGKFDEADKDFTGKQAAVTSTIQFKISKSKLGMIDLLRTHESVILTHTGCPLLRGLSLTPGFDRRWLERNVAVSSKRTVPPLIASTKATIAAFQALVSNPPLSRQCENCKAMIPVKDTHTHFYCPIDKKLLDAALQQPNINPPKAKQDAEEGKLSSKSSKGRKRKAHSATGTEEKAESESSDSQQPPTKRQSTRHRKTVDRGVMIYDNDDADAGQDIEKDSDFESETSQD